MAWVRPRRTPVRLELWHPQSRYKILRCLPVKPGRAVRTVDHISHRGVNGAHCPWQHLHRLASALHCSGAAHPYAQRVAVTTKATQRECGIAAHVIRRPHPWSTGRCAGPPPIWPIRSVRGADVHGTPEFHSRIEMRVHGGTGKRNQRRRIEEQVAPVAVISMPGMPSALRFCWQGAARWHPWVRKADAHVPEAVRPGQSWIVLKVPGSST